MAIGDEEPAPTIDILNWHDLYNNTISEDDAVLEGIAYRGRWTGIAAAAKAGKSTVILGLAVAAAQKGVVVLYVDAEMGRTDVLERVADWMDLKPDDLENLHYTDLPPKLDNVQGATALYNTVKDIKPDLVIIDGLNGVVNGAENEDTTWRDMYEWAIAPLKEMGIAVVSLDNAGHGERKGPRGSSIKLDKADAILFLTRTDTGVKIQCTHRRTASYPLEQEYTVTDADESGPPMNIERVGAGQGAPHGTNRIIGILDDLGAPLDIGRRKARELLKSNGHEAPRNAELGQMLRWRREHAEIPVIHNHISGVIHNPTQVVPWSPGPPGTSGTTPHLVVPDSGDHLEETPARGVVPDRWSTQGPPPVEAPKTPGTTSGPEDDYGELF